METVELLLIAILATLLIKTVKESRTIKHIDRTLEHKKGTIKRKYGKK